jgi:hypothetical protein
MSSRRSRPSAGCSRPNSRRNNAKAPIVPILFLLSASVFLSAQEARLDAVLRGGRVYAAVEYLDSHFAERGVSANQDVLSSMWEGLRAEITFQLRLYRRARGIFAFLGDRLVSERRVHQIASFDFYENRYKIQMDDRMVGEYSAEAEFLAAFYSLPETEIGELEAGGEADYYLLARVRMMPVKIISPLNIITLFSTDTVFTTPWVEAELKL